MIGAQLLCFTCTSGMRRALWTRASVRHRGSTRGLSTYSDTNRSATDLGGDAEAMRTARPSQHVSDSAAQAERLYTVIREPESVVDVRAWLGPARGHGEFEVPMERAARQQLALLSQLSRRRVEQGSSTISAALPQWMKASSNMPAYRSLRPFASASADRDILSHPIAVMPDVHVGNGTTVGTVIPTYRALIPSCVGVDIGCGMLALKTSLRNADLSGGSTPAGSNGRDRLLANLRMAIEIAVPHGRTHSGAEGNDAGGWRSQVPQDVADIWKGELDRRFQGITAKYPTIARSNNVNHLGTLGTGNHFIEICVEEPLTDTGLDAEGNLTGSSELQALHPSVFGYLSQTGHGAVGLSVANELIAEHAEQQRALARERGGSVWIMLHSGSRGVGGKIGSTFIDVARRDMGTYYGDLPNGELAYLREGDTPVGAEGSYFSDYCEALSWAQDYARWNRELMAARVVAALRSTMGIPKDFVTEAKAVNCHHNYVERMNVLTGQILPGLSGSRHGIEGTSHIDDPNVVYITRKGATSAQRGELAIIPGSMGARSFIVQGKGNLDSYCSCSHGAGRRYSRGEARRRYTIDDHEAATEGIACRKDSDVIDETPMAYKDVDTVIRAQRDLVDVVCVLRQVLCVKG